MKLSKSVQVALGFAASSGMLLVLSGSAFAAEAGTVTTTQTPASTNQLVAEPTETAASASEKDGSASLPEVKTPELVGEVAVSDDLSAGTASAAHAKAPKEPVSLETNADKTGLSASSKTTNVDAAPASLPAASKLKKAETEAAAQAPTEAVRVLEASKPQSLPVAPHVEPQALEGIVYRSTVLPIQPVITNHAASRVTDLAASMPSAPVPVREPVPTKSNGDLGKLTAELAGTVVPQPVLPAAPPAPRAMLAFLLIALTIVTLTIFAFTYGQWLRRGGFATAARSDEPSAFSFFATPHLKGYVPTPPRLHSPFSMMVAETNLRTILVPNAFRKEEMA